MEGQQGHYLARVMRVSLGTTVILCDDETGEWAATVVESSKRAVRLRVEEKLRDREDPPQLVLCTALLKKPRFDLVLEKATELGVAAIQPVVTRRCVATKLNVERARAVVIEAAEQCARTALPVVHEPVALDTMLRHWPGDHVLYFADESGDATPAAEAFAEHLPPAGILIGPEGGFDAAERAAVRAAIETRPITLGPRILRAETAAIAATSAWMAIAGDWSAPAGNDK